MAKTGFFTDGNTEYTATDDPTTTVPDSSVDTGAPVSQYKREGGIYQAIDLADTSIATVEANVAAAQAAQTAAAGSATAAAASAASASSAATAAVTTGIAAIRYSFAAPADYTVSGSPAAPGGTITLSRGSQTAKYVLAAPNGSAGVPGYRQLVASDISGLGTGATLVAGTTAQYLRGDWSWQTLPTYSLFTSAANGLAPAYPNNTTTFLRGDGTYAVPSYPAVPVASVFGRTGAVVSATNDYAFSQISGTITYGQITSGAIATAAQIMANTASTLLSTNAVWAANNLTTYTQASSVAINLASGINFWPSVQATGATTFTVTYNANVSVQSGFIGWLNASTATTVSWAAGTGTAVVVPNSIAPSTPYAGAWTLFIYVQVGGTVFISKVFN